MCKYCSPNKKMVKIRYRSSFNGKMFGIEGSCEDIRNIEICRNEIGKTGATFECFKYCPMCGKELVEATDAKI